MADCYVNAPASEKKQSFFEPFAGALRICDIIFAKAKESRESDTMTVNSRAMKNITYQTEKERLEEAAKELNMASNITEYIYNSRQLPPNESQLIKNFYYSIYHLVKAISVLDTGIEYESHSSLISYFNREIKHEDFLKKFDVDISDIRDVGNELNTLFVFRDNYDYRDAAVDEEDYKEAEEIWQNLYPKLENIVILILNSMK